MIKFIRSKELEQVTSEKRDTFWIFFIHLCFADVIIAFFVNCVLVQLDSSRLLSGTLFCRFDPFRFLCLLHNV